MTITLELSPAKSLITIPPEEYNITLRNLLDSVTSYRTKGAFFSKAVQKGRWDGKKYFINWQTRKCATGLIPEIETALKENGYPVEVIDEIEYPEPSFDWIFTPPPDLENRQYQEDTVQTCLREKRGIVHLPVGTGKTTVMAMLIAKLGVSCLIVVHTRELLEQARKRIKLTLGIEVNKIGMGEWETGSPITVGTVQTLCKHKKKIPRTDLIIADECHHSSAKTWQAVMLGLSAPYRFGFSATPFKLNSEGMGLVAVTSKVVVTKKTTEMMDAGYLSPVSCYMINSHFEGRLLAHDWPEVEQKGIVFNDIRNKIIASLARNLSGRGKSVLIIVSKIAHGEEIAKWLFCDYVYLHGSVDTETRLSALEKFKDGEIKVVIATSIWDEGVDIPRMDALIVGAGGASPTKTIQRAGRVLRNYKGKEKAFIFDFWDTFHRLTLKHSKARYGTYHKEIVNVKKEMSYADVWDEITS